MSRTIQHKELVATRLANNYGGWIYCEGCNKSIGYLCYVTYNRFKFNYQCKCGNAGSAYLVFESDNSAQPSDQQLITIKNRLCCPTDESPLFTILAKNLDTYKYEVICKSCNAKYSEGKKSTADIY